MKMGGHLSVINAVRKVNPAAVGPSTFWGGGWMLTKADKGHSSLVGFYNECKQQGLTPLVHFWFWGDDISPTNLVNGVMDQHQKVWKDWSLAREQAILIAKTAAEVGVEPIVTMEGEFNKRGMESSVKMRDYFWDMLTTMRKHLPSIKTVFAPGLWGTDAEAHTMATFFKDVASSMDYIGVQCVKFPPRHGDYTNMDEKIAARLHLLRNSIGDKPTCVYDCVLSTYAGGDKTHPFAGGDGRAFEQQQAETLAGMAKLHSEGIDFFVYRNLRDNPNFALSNWGGHAERYGGVIRSDGSKKPGYSALMALAQPTVSPPPSPEPTPEPPAPTPDPVEQMAERIAKLEADLASLVGALGTAQKVMTAIIARLDGIDERMEAAAQSLRGAP